MTTTWACCHARRTTVSQQFNCAAAQPTVSSARDAAQCTWCQASWLGWDWNEWRQQRMWWKGKRVSKGGIKIKEGKRGKEEQTERGKSTSAEQKDRRRGGGEEEGGEWTERQETVCVFACVCVRVWEVKGGKEKKTGRKNRRGTFNGPAVVFVSTLWQPESIINQDHKPLERRRRKCGREVMGAREIRARGCREGESRGESDEEKEGGRRGMYGSESYQEKKGGEGGRMTQFSQHFTEKQL